MAGAAPRPTHPCRPRAGVRPHRGGRGSEPRRWSRSASFNASASGIRKAARHSTISPRSRRPAAPSPAASMYGDGLLQPSPGRRGCGRPCCAAVGRHRIRACGGRTTTASGIEQRLGHGPSSGSNEMPAPRAAHMAAASRRPLLLRHRRDSARPPAQRPLAPPSRMEGAVSARLLLSTKAVGRAAPPRGAAGPSLVEDAASLARALMPWASVPVVDAAVTSFRAEPTD